MTANARTIDHFLHYASPAVEPIRSLAELKERTPQREGLRLLATWCHERRYHASVNVASELQEPVARVLAQLGGDGGHEDLVEPLALVEAEIENVLEAAASEEEE